MPERLFRSFLALVLFAACVYLVQVDYSEKLEADVSSLLPESETEESRLLRRLVSEELGRSVYIELSGLPEQMAEASALEVICVEDWEASSVVEAVVEIDRDTNARAFALAGTHRMELLFPQWWAARHALYEQADGVEAAFSPWAAQSAVEDLNLFLESPIALELAQPGLLDPLLLNISALLNLVESEDADAGSGVRPARQSSSEVAANVSGDARYYWMTLAASPLDPEVQESVAALMVETGAALRLESPAARIEYGGLVRLASASRTRIQQDVFKINVLSVLGVIGVACFLLRKPWQLGLVLPALIVGALGAVTVSFLVFDRINVIVLVVGSILIGTAIDYAIHLLSSAAADDADFPARKLVALACFSTVSGFMILLFADLELIRQIGVFVGSGLLAAYLSARFFIGEGRWSCGLAVRTLPQWQFGGVVPRVLACVLLGFVLVQIGGAVVRMARGAHASDSAGGAGLLGVQWQDDIRNLEAPDAALVEADLALRERFGMRASTTVFLTTGATYLELFEREQALMKSAERMDETYRGFGISSFLPNASDVDQLSLSEGELAPFFENLREALEGADYEVEMFEPFFEQAEVFSSNQGEGAALYERWVGAFSSALAGPMGELVGGDSGQYWSLCSLAIPLDGASVLADSLEHSSVFSQLSFFNKSLDGHRQVLARFGLFALGAVVFIVLFVLGVRQGAVVVLFPLLGGFVAISVSSLFFEQLNMFHLIGCFLGGAIALDYALFSVESFVRGRLIPSSVWLSAGTTIASFLALAFSAIPVVQGLGVMVALITSMTLLFLCASRGLVCKILPSK